jgi:hypothetical protein
MTIRAVLRHTTVYLVLQYEILVSQPIVVYMCMLCEYMTIRYVVQRIRDTGRTQSKFNTPVLFPCSLTP